MRRITLVLACLACLGHGHRVELTSEQMREGLLEQYQNSQNAGNTSSSSPSLAELEQSQSSEQAGIPLKLATLLVALSNPAAAFAPQNPRVLAPGGRRPVTGHGHKFAVPIGIHAHRRGLHSAVRMSQKDMLPSDDPLTRNMSDMSPSDVGDMFPSDDPLTGTMSDKAYAENLCGLDSKQRPRALFFYDGG